MTNRVFTFLYGTVSYALFFITFLYAIGFVGNFAVYKSLDSVSANSLQTGLLVDLGLLAIFALQQQFNGTARLQARHQPGSTGHNRAQHLRSG